MPSCRSHDKDNDFSGPGGRGDREEVGGPSRPPQDYEGPPGMQTEGLIEVCFYRVSTLVRQPGPCCPTHFIVDYCLSSLKPGVWDPLH